MADPIAFLIHVLIGIGIAIAYLVNTDRPARELLAFVMLMVFIGLAMSILFAPVHP